jgi:lysophospholipase L1-like esterase
MLAMWKKWVRTPQGVLIAGVLLVGALSTAAVAAQVSANNANAVAIKTAATSTTTYATIAAAFNNVAVTDNAAPSKGNFDANGYTYSYQDLVGLGWKPGQAVTYGGTKLTWPNVAAGAADNVVAAGQNITLSGKGTALTFLVAADHGPASGTVKLTYSDATTATATIVAPDWVGGNAAQHIIAGAHLNNAAGQQTSAAQVFPVTIPLNSAKTLSKVTLPTTASPSRMHIFTMAMKPVATGWSSSWNTANETAVAVPWKNETLRMVTHTSVGGTQVRLRFSNTMNSVPVTLGHVTVAVQKDAWVPRAAPVTIKFGGSNSVTMPAGGEVTSDAIAMNIPANSRLLISEYLPGDVTSATIHYNALENNYNAPADAGDHTADQGTYPVSNTFIFTAFLAGVDVNSSAGTVVAFGDSITDGIGSTMDSDTRWPDYLSARLGGSRGVANAGISGNQLLHDQMTGNGVAAINRLYRDAISLPGVKSIVLLEGVNDLNGGASATDVENALKQLVALAHKYGVKVFMSTITPAGGRPAAVETNHQAVNNWVRSGTTATTADYGVDFSEAITIGGNPEGIFSIYDSGDQLHPNSAGYNSMASWLDTTKF